jgi:hypothetical protein
MSTSRPNLGGLNFLCSLESNDRGMRPVFNIILENHVENTAVNSASICFAEASADCTLSGAGNLPEKKRS